MLNKLFSFLGFNCNENYIGLSQLYENQETVVSKVKKVPKKELKLSDLMRGN